MRCEELQNELALHVDGTLPEMAAEKLRSHLGSCPLCRQRFDDMNRIRAGLRSLARPAMRDAVLDSIRQSVRSTVEPSSGLFTISYSRRLTSRYKLWAAAYACAACATIVFGFGFFWLIFLANMDPRRSPSMARNSSDRMSPVMLSGDLPAVDPRLVLSAKDFADTRSDIAAVSPSVNPQGSLIELTKSLLNNDIRNDEVVVVADVYRNGTAQIAQVVEPSKNQNAVSDLAKALDYEAVNSPFVAADLDQRSDSIRVVLKIQSVNVSINERVRKRRLSL